MDHGISAALAPLRALGRLAKMGWQSSSADRALAAGEASSALEKRLAEIIGQRGADPTANPVRAICVFPDHTEAADLYADASAWVDHYRHSLENGGDGPSSWLLVELCGKLLAAELRGLAGHDGGKVDWSAPDLGPDLGAALALWALLREPLTALETARALETLRGRALTATGEARKAYAAAFGILDECPPAKMEAMEHPFPRSLAVMLCQRLFVAELQLSLAEEDGRALVLSTVDKPVPVTAVLARRGVSLQVMREGLATANLERALSRWFKAYKVEDGSWSCWTSSRRLPPDEGYISAVIRVHLDTGEWGITTPEIFSNHREHFRQGIGLVSLASALFGVDPEMDSADLDAPLWGKS